MSFPFGMKCKKCDREIGKIISPAIEQLAPLGLEFALQRTLSPSLDQNSPIREADMPVVLRNAWLLYANLICLLRRSCEPASLPLHGRSAPSGFARVT